MTLTNSPLARAIRELIDTICPVCSDEKKKGESFCPHCYFSLTPEQRQALYTPWGNGYAEIYDGIRKELRARR